MSFFCAEEYWTGVCTGFGWGFLLAGLCVGDLVRAWIARIEAGETPRRAAKYLGESPKALRGIAELEPHWAEALRKAERK